MNNHNLKQKKHYERQYSQGKHSLFLTGDADLWEYAKWYPISLIEDFTATLKNRGDTILTICSGMGRELGLFHRQGFNITATDLVIDQLACLQQQGIINSAEVQNAERLNYNDKSFDYGYVNARLHHLKYPHMGLCELLRVTRKAVIFIEAQDSLLHSITRTLGRKQADFEPAGNYVYRWRKREIEKIALSAHLHSFAIKTSFLPIFIKMREVKAGKKQVCIRILKILNWFFGRVGNIMVCILFIEKPTDEQITALKNKGYYYKLLSR